MIIQKFGGTSVSTRERINTICNIVQSHRAKHPVVVVSAIRGVTDLLLSCIDTSQQKRKKMLKEIEQIHTKLIRSYWKENMSGIQVYLTQCLQEIEKTLQKKDRNKKAPYHPEPLGVQGWDAPNGASHTVQGKAVSDYIVSYGEILSSRIISQALNAAGISSQQVIATDSIVTDDNFTNAEFLPSQTRRKTRKMLLPLLKKGVVPVVTGFIAATKNGQTTTLGRGGSDYTAAILGFVLHASEIQIWTDVDGIYTADPRFVKTAAMLSSVTFKEASELATFGAKVLHPRTIRPAVSLNIPVRVLNTLNPDREGTTIVGSTKQLHRIAAIACKREVMLVNLYATEMLLSKGFLEKIFGVFARHTISVDLVSVSEVSVSVTLDNTDNLQDALSELKQFTAVTTKQVGVVSLVGEGIAKVPRIMRNIFSVLDIAQVPVHMVSVGASDINISIVTDSSLVDIAVSLLHDSVLLGDSFRERRYL